MNDIGRARAGRRPDRVWRVGMGHPERSHRAEGARKSPGPATAAGAGAPSPPSARVLRLLLDVLLLVPCGVAGVLLPFTAVPLGYSVLLLGLAALAAVDLIWAPWGGPPARGADRGTR